jgi:hypothetical protein
MKQFMTWVNLRAYDSNRNYAVYSVFSLCSYIASTYCEENRDAVRGWNYILHSWEIYLENDPFAVNRVNDSSVL